MNRREFIVLTAATACACCMGDLSAQQAPADPLDIGQIDDYPTDGVYDRFVKPHKVLIIRQSNHLYALTAVCTHKGKTLRVKEGQIICPAHGSEFGHDGLATAGPAKHPLNRFAITQNDAGHIIVDRTQAFPRDQWDNPRSFIKI